MPEAERREPCVILNHSEGKGIPMKWQITRTYWKVAIVLGSIGAAVMAAAADFKWGP